MTADPYFDPRAGVLRNRLGITDPERLAAAEAGLSLAAISELGTRVQPGGYDLLHLQAFHEEIFGDIYAWAGQIRTISIAKTDPFCLPQHIESYAAEVFTALAKERHLRGLPREAFVGRLTHYYAEVNAVHPFREGNGRAQRAFFHQLCRQSGWPIDWSGLDEERNSAASAAALRGDNSPLHALIDEHVDG